MTLDSRDLHRPHGPSTLWASGGWKSADVPNGTDPNLHKKTAATNQNASQKGKLTELHWVNPLEMDDKHTKHEGQIHHGKSPCSIAMFISYAANYQRVDMGTWSPENRVVNLRISRNLIVGRSSSLLPRFKLPCQGEMIINNRILPSFLS